MRARGLIGFTADGVEQFEAGVELLLADKAVPVRWPVCSRSSSTIRTARSRSSGGYRPDVVGDCGLAATRTVIGPRLWEVQLPVDQRLSTRRPAGEEDAELTVLDPPRRAGVLTLHPPGSRTRSTLVHDGTSGCSDRRRGARNDGKCLPVRNLGTRSSNSPTRVSHVLDQ